MSTCEEKAYIHFRQNDKTIRPVENFFSSFSNLNGLNFILSKHTSFLLSSRYLSLSLSLPSNPRSKNTSTTEFELYKKEI